MAHFALISSSRGRAALLAGVAALTLTACGAEDIASPGEGTIVLPAPTPAPAPAPTPTPTTVTPAAACPTIAGPDQLTNLGTISGPQGSITLPVVAADGTLKGSLAKGDLLLALVQSSIFLGQSK